MSIVAFILAAALLGASLYSAGVCGRVICRRLMPNSTGLLARLGESVVAIAVLLCVAELLGSVALFSPIPFVVVLIASAAILRATLRAGPQGPSEAEVPAVPLPAVVISIVVAALVVVHWSIGTWDALQTGITGYDSNWYHLPLTAKFVQSGSTLDFAAISPRYQAWFYPANSELLNAVMVLPFRRDFLIPLMNMGWLIGTLAAAWCVGRPFGKGPWTLIAAAVLLDSGVMADQAGDARNDITGLFFILAAIALLLSVREQRLEDPPIGVISIAGLAAGLAAGVKLTMIAPAAGLILGVILTARRGHRAREAVAILLPALAGGGFWFVRNLLAAGNPLPWYRSLGPIHLDGVNQALGGRPPASIVHYLSDGTVWQAWFFPGLHERLGALWPVLLLLVAAGLLVCLFARRERFLRAAAAAGLLGIPLYLIDGTSAEGPAGMPIGFISSLRHIAPSFLIGLVLLPLLPILRPERRSWIVLVGLALLLPLAGVSSHDWSLVVVLPTVIAVLGLAAAIRWKTPRVPRPWRLPATALGGAIGLALIWALQISYSEQRYEEPSFRSAGLQEGFEKLGLMQDQKIATTLPLQYPLYGANYSNQVDYLGDPGDDATVRPIRGCAGFRRALRNGGYRFLMTDVAGGSRHSSVARWVRGPRVRTILRDRHIVIYKLLEPPDPSTCRGL